LLTIVRAFDWRLQVKVSLVSIIKASVFFPEKDLFQDVGIQIEQGDRIGLVGPNGAGKTTILRLITGEMEPDRGEVRISKGVRIGYLPQDVQEGMKGGLLEAVVNSVPDLVSLRDEVYKTQSLLENEADPQEQGRIAHKLAELHQRLQFLDQQYPRHQAEKILVGLGFSQDDFSSPISSLSGGWKTRAALASLLHQKPDLLLMDEPTNHLDIPSVRWLEQYLKEFKGAIVLVSHDRRFLNSQVKRIIGFEPEGLRFYTGNYDQYLKAREEEERALEARAANQEQKLKEAQRFIERFKAKSSKARQAQSKIKLVKKMEFVETHRKEKTLNFSFPPVPQSARVVATFKGISKAFGPKVLYRDIEMTVLRQERVAIVGPNGSGKTTLLKIVAGELAPDKGSIILGHGVTMGYFAQHQSEALDPNKKIIEEIYQILPDAPLTFIRSLCGAFLFSGDQVEKPVGVLSGGEKARVSLAKLLVKPGNFMVMDEPTNHLDLISSEKLIDALLRYEGTLLFVSHNQSFVNRLATKIWEIKDGRISEYPGNLDEYYEHLRRLEELDKRPQLQIMGNRSEDASDQGQKRENRKEQKRERAERRKAVQDVIGPIVSGLERIEKDMEECETRKKEVEKLLADPEVFKDKNRAVPLLTEYNLLRDRAEELMAEWEQKQMELDAARQKLALTEE
jgi:ATP-binding cassette subfamily F protein 3